MLHNDYMYFEFLPQAFYIKWVAYQFILNCMTIKQCDIAYSSNQKFMIGILVK